MQINMTSINEKVKEYAKSDEGQKKTEKFGQVATAEEVQLLGTIMASLMLSSLPESLQDSFAGVDPTSMVGAVKVNKNSMAVSVSFPVDLLRRESLLDSETGERTGKGVDNIVVLLNNGYDAGGAVYGTWESRGTETWSLSHREGIHFMQSAVDAFNQMYGKKYNVTATLGGQYT